MDIILTFKNGIEKNFLGVIPDSLKTEDYAVEFDLFTSKGVDNHHVILDGTTVAVTEFVYFKEDKEYLKSKRREEKKDES